MVGQLNPVVPRRQREANKGGIGPQDWGRVAINGRRPALGIRNRRGQDPVARRGQLPADRVRREMQLFQPVGLDLAHFALVLVPQPRGNHLVLQMVGAELSRLKGQLGR